MMKAQLTEELDAVRYAASMYFYYGKPKMTIHLKILYLQPEEM